MPIGRKRPVKETQQVSKKSKQKQPKEPEISKHDIVKVELTPSQIEYFNKICDSDITFCYGPAGTSKTYTACFAALHLYLSGKIKKIILSKPIQESGEKLGFLPGPVKDKIDPFMESYRTNLVKLLKDSTLVNWLEQTGVIEFRPLAYMRGSTFDDCLMILDESQNANFKQLMLFVTRIGRTSKALVCGDVSQSDIAKDQIALPDFINLMQGIPGIAIHKFIDSDVMRKDILIQLIKRYETWKENNPNHKFIK